MARLVSSLKMCRARSLYQGFANRWSADWRALARVPSSEWLYDMNPLHQLLSNIQQSSASTHAQLTERTSLVPCGPGSEAVAETECLIKLRVESEVASRRPPGFQFFRRSLPDEPRPF